MIFSIILLFKKMFFVGKINQSVFLITKLKRIGKTIVRFGLTVQQTYLGSWMGIFSPLRLKKLSLHIDQKSKLLL